MMQVTDFGLNFTDAERVPEAQPVSRVAPEHHVVHIYDFAGRRAVTVSADQNGRRSALAVICCLSIAVIGLLIWMAVSNPKKS